MNLKKHSAELVGRHAFLSPSKYSWVNYEPDKLIRTYHTNREAQRGTELHALAHDLIRLGVKLPRTQKTLNMYVNDAIGHRMTPEQILYFSPNCFGTVDAISFRKNLLRVSDLKTGVTPASEKQLEVYVALFCLEYGFKPMDIDIEMRIYQSDEIRVYDSDDVEIMRIMDKIESFDRLINEMRLEELS